MASDKKLRNKSIVFTILTIVLWLWALSYIFVVVWGLVTSCRNGIAFAINDSSMFGLTDKKRLPTLEITYTLKNFAKAFSEIKDDITGTSFFGMFANSLWITFGMDFASIIIKITTAYALAFYDFKGKGAIHKFFILQMIIPGFGSMNSTYRLLATMGMIDNPLFLLSMISGHGMTMLIFHGYFVGLSRSYAEAARIDGANEFLIFFKISLPMAKSVIAALFVQSFIGLWQDYGSVLIYFPSYPTLATGLFTYSARAAYVMDTPTYFAGLLIANIPITILFCIFNKTMLENITIGGLKG